MWKRLMLSLMLVASTATVMVEFAEAKRIGGGRSLGMQRSTTPPARQATPPSAAPQQATPAARPATAQAQPPAQSGWRRFAGPLAGLAAGIGLAALLSHFGIGGEFAGIILAVLAAVVVFAVGGITDRGQESACDADFKTLEVAYEAYIAQFGSSATPTETQLVNGDFLRQSSNLMNITSGGEVVIEDADCGTVNAAYVPN